MDDTRTPARRAAALGAALLIAVAAVLLVAPGVGGTTTPRAEDPGAAPPAPVERWRAEHWRSVAVDVPADWGYGGAPIARGRNAVACWPEAMVGPRGRAIADGGSMGYVGRPIMLTDVCLGYPGHRSAQRDAPYVWLGAAVEPGRVPLGDGFVQETVAVYGTTVTVASDDRALRRRVLDSVRPGRLCPARLPGDPDRAAVAYGPPRGAQVCAYERRDGHVGLTYATRLGRDAGRAFAAAYAATATTAGAQMCQPRPAMSWVVVRVGSRVYVAQGLQGRGCARVDGPAGAVRLVPALVRPWADGGTRSVTTATNTERWMWRYFIGPLG